MPFSFQETPPGATEAARQRHHQAAERIHEAVGASRHLTEQLPWIEHGVPRPHVAVRDAMHVEGLERVFVEPHHVGALARERDAERVALGVEAEPGAHAAHLEHALLALEVAELHLRCRGADAPDVTGAAVIMHAVGRCGGHRGGGGNGQLVGAPHDGRVAQAGVMQRRLRGLVSPAHVSAPASETIGMARAGEALFALRESWADVERRQPRPGLGDTGEDLVGILEGREPHDRRERTAHQRG
jgi:hypothetical protein